MDQQNEFLFADGAEPILAMPDPRAGFFLEVSQIWNLPLGQRARFELRGHDLPEISGRLELARAPDLPLNAREVLQLSVGRIAFKSTQVQGWSLLD